MGESAVVGNNLGSHRDPLLSIYIYIWGKYSDMLASYYDDDFFFLFSGEKTIFAIFFYMGWEKSLLIDSLSSKKKKKKEREKDRVPYSISNEGCEKNTCFTYSNTILSILLSYFSFYNLPRLYFYIHQNKIIYTSE